MHNPTKRTAWGTQNAQKNTTQYGLDTILRKQTQLTNVK
jgi:hypothetical protein